MKKEPFRCKIVFLILVMQKKRTRKSSMRYSMLTHRFKNMKKLVHQRNKKMKMIELYIKIQKKNGQKVANLLT